MANQNRDLSISMLEVLQIERGEYESKARHLKHDASEARKNNLTKEGDRLELESFKYFVKSANTDIKIIRIKKKLQKEKNFAEILTLYLDRCKLNGIIPDEPILYNCTEGAKYFYLKRGTTVIAKFDKKEKVFE